MSLMLTKGLGPAIGKGGRQWVAHFNPANVILRKKGSFGTKIRPLPQLKVTLTQRLAIEVQPIAYRKSIKVTVVRKTVRTKIR
jgi:hypothetical protein